MILGRFKDPSTELSARAWLLLGVAHPRAGDGEVGRDGGGSVSRRAQRTCVVCVSAAGGAVGSAGRERGRDMFKGGAQRAAT